MAANEIVETTPAQFTQSEISKRALQDSKIFSHGGAGYSAVSALVIIPISVYLAGWSLVTLLDALGIWALSVLIPGFIWYEVMVRLAPSKLAKELSDSISFESGSKAVHDKLDAIIGHTERLSLATSRSEVNVPALRAVDLIQESFDNNHLQLNLKYKNISTYSIHITGLRPSLNFYDGPNYSGVLSWQPIESVTVTIQPNEERVLNIGGIRTDGAYLLQTLRSGLKTLAVAVSVKYRIERSDGEQEWRFARVLDNQSIAEQDAIGQAIMMVGTRWKMPSDTSLNSDSNPYPITVTDPRIPIGGAMIQCMNMELRGFCPPNDESVLTFIARFDLFNGGTGSKVNNWSVALNIEDAVTPCRLLEEIPPSLPLTSTWVGSRPEFSSLLSAGKLPTAKRQSGYLVFQCPMSLIQQIPPSGCGVVVRCEDDMGTTWSWDTHLAYVHKIDSKW